MLAWDVMEGGKYEQLFSLLYSFVFMRAPPSVYTQSNPTLQAYNKDCVLKQRTWRIPNVFFRFDHFLQLDYPWDEF